jgi:hypothetical protein
MKVTQKIKMIQKTKMIQLRIKHLKNVKSSLSISNKDNMSLFGDSNLQFNYIYNRKQDKYN